ncbi:hypothetical protein IFM89_013720 [Coptis chinensis]|uniref:DNA-directed RNA polymerase III subunit RPC9 n=1 Tax=Coptis chinensis TaxID=261450 RepID=A0A835LRQ1_9MAGN|nr:hypothetical protein IFM89_013720 [Coptis chinensis]
MGLFGIFLIYGLSLLVCKVFILRIYIYRLQTNAGALTNFEVLDFLRSRGASTDPTRVIASVAQSEFQVYDYLVQSAACNQTRESINEFLRCCEKFDLAKAEKINIINIRPASQVEIDPIIEDCEKRIHNDEVEDLVNMIVEVLPSSGKTGGTDEETVEAVADQEPMEVVLPPEGKPGGTDEETKETVAGQDPIDTI